MTNEETAQAIADLWELLAESGALGKLPLCQWCGSPATGDGYHGDSKCTATCEAHKAADPHWRNDIDSTGLAHRFGRFLQKVAHLNDGLVRKDGT